MAQATRNLFVNLTDGTLQRSASDGTTYTLPPFIVGDELSLVLTFLRRTTGGIVPTYTTIDPSGISAKVAIGPGDGTPDALATTFSVSGQTLTGLFQLNTAALQSAVDAGEVLYFEIKTVESGYATTPIQLRADVRDSVTDASATAPTPAEDYMTRAESTGTFVKKVGTAGEAIILTSSGGTRIALTATDQGTFQITVL